MIRSSFLAIISWITLQNCLILTISAFAPIGCFFYCIDSYLLYIPNILGSQICRAKHHTFSSLRATIPSTERDNAFVEPPSIRFTPILITEYTILKEKKISNRYNNWCTVSDNINTIIPENPSLTLNDESNINTTANKANVTFATTTTRNFVLMIVWVENSQHTEIFRKPDFIANFLQKESRKYYRDVGIEIKLTIMKLNQTEPNYIQKSN